MIIYNRLLTTKKTVILASLLIGLIGTSHAQEANQPEAELYNNALYGTVGIGGLYFTATGYYERIITQKGRLAHFAKIGMGGYALWGIGGQYLLGQYGILTGKKKHHLELGFGPSWFLNGDLEGESYFSATLGYRIQKPGGKFMFRAGASWPEAVYIGIGFPF